MLDLSTTLIWKKRTSVPFSSYQLILVEMCTEMHVTWPVIFSDFNQNLNVLENLINIQKNNVDLFVACGQTDRQTDKLAGW